MMRLFKEKNVFNDFTSPQRDIPCMSSFFPPLIVSRDECWFRRKWIGRNVANTEHQTEGMFGGIPPLCRLVTYFHYDSLTDFFFLSFQLILFHFYGYTNFCSGKANQIDAPLTFLWMSRSASREWEGRRREEKRASLFSAKIHENGNKMQGKNT